MDILPFCSVHHGLGMSVRDKPVEQPIMVGVVMGEDDIAKVLQGCPDISETADQSIKRLFRIPARVHKQTALGGFDEIGVDTHGFSQHRDLYTVNIRSDSLFPVRCHEAHPFCADFVIRLL